MAQGKWRKFTMFRVNPPGLPQLVQVFVREHDDRTEFMVNHTATGARVHDTDRDVDALKARVKDKIMAALSPGNDTWSPWLRVILTTHGRALNDKGKFAAACADCDITVTRFEVSGSIAGGTVRSRVGGDTVRDGMPPEGDYSEEFGKRSFNVPDTPTNREAINVILKAVDAVGHAVSGIGTGQDAQRVLDAVYMTRSLKPLGVEVTCQTESRHSHPPDAKPSPGSTSSGG